LKNPPPPNPQPVAKARSYQQPWQSFRHNKRSSSGEKQRRPDSWLKKKLGLKKKSEERLRRRSGERKPRL
jgi:hypothetical protein